MQVKPVSDRVVVQRVEKDDKTPGGLFIPDNAKEKPQEAVVIAAGPGRHESGEVVPMCVSASDRVLIGKFAGSEITVDGEDYVIVRQDDILAILEG